MDLTSKVMDDALHVPFEVDNEELAAQVENQVLGELGVELSGECGVRSHAVATPC
jgi:hypothetical protein